MSPLWERLSLLWQRPSLLCQWLSLLWQQMSLLWKQLNLLWERLPAAICDAARAVSLLWERLVAAIFAQRTIRLARSLARTGALMAALVTTCACARPADVPDQAVAAHSTAGKPVAPIAIDYRFVDQPVVGQPLQIELTIRTRSTMSDVAIELVGGASLVVSDTTRQVSRITADTPYRFTATVLPEEAALLQLGVSVDGSIGPARQARSITIPIRLGTKRPASQAAPDLKVGPSGNVVHSLPAEERSDSRGRRP